MEILRVKDSNLLQYDAVSLVGWFPKFQKHHVPAKLLYHLTLEDASNRFHRNVGSSQPTAQRHNPDALNIQAYRCENLKIRMKVKVETEFPLHTERV
jgi:hypothetical protein